MMKIKNSYVHLSKATYAFSIMMHVIVEAVFDWWSIAKLSAVASLHGFAQNVS